MGIYYYAVDENSKTIMSPPNHFSPKNVAIFHPNNPFPAMVMMKNIQGYKYEIISDVKLEVCFTWKDVTYEVYRELIRLVPDWGKLDEASN